MAAIQSSALDLGTQAPDFALPDPAGTVYGLAQFSEAPALLVAFICNHCPYVKHIADGFAAFAREYQGKGLAIVAISPNDVGAYPDDAPPKMAEFAKAHGFGFPYLYDESQAVARAYGAVCTPDLYLFDRLQRLAYHGQFDASRPGSKGPVTGADLRAAANALLGGSRVPAVQMPSVGCSIKWKKA